MLLLDIQLSTDINGIKLGSEIRKHDPVGNIIFVTSHSELTYLTFVYKVAAMDFIFKDDPAELKTRIIDCLETAHTRLQLLSKDNSVETIELKRGSNSVYVQYDDIMFFESSTKSHRLIAHLDNRQIEFYGNLKELSQLDDRFSDVIIVLLSIVIISNPLIRKNELSILKIKNIVMHR